jgi:hypothetical protein
VWYLRKIKDFSTDAQNVSPHLFRQCKLLESPITQKVLKTTKKLAKKAVTDSLLTALNNAKSSCGGEKLRG